LTRFYDISIEATDLTGNNKGTATCSVIVVPKDHYQGGNPCDDHRHVARDLQIFYCLSLERYTIAEETLKWDPKLNRMLRASQPNSYIKSGFCNNGKNAGSKSKSGFETEEVHHLIDNNNEDVQADLRGGNTKPEDIQIDLHGGGNIHRVINAFRRRKNGGLRA
jgi:hypothetical protein